MIKKSASYAADLRLISQDILLLHVQDSYKKENDSYSPISLTLPVDLT